MWQLPKWPDKIDRAGKIRKPADHAGDSNSESVEGNFRGLNEE